MTGSQFDKLHDFTRTFFLHRNNYYLQNLFIQFYPNLPSSGFLTLLLPCCWNIIICNYRDDEATSNLIWNANFSNFTSGNSNTFFCWLSGRSKWNSRDFIKGSALDNIERNIFTIWLIFKIKKFYKRKTITRLCVKTQIIIVAVLLFFSFVFHFTGCKTRKTPKILHLRWMSYTEIKSSSRKIHWMNENWN